MSAAREGATKAMDTIRTRRQMPIQWDSIRATRDLRLLTSVYSSLAML
jgi:hypothetical protein